MNVIRILNDQLWGNARDMTYEEKQAAYAEARARIRDLSRELYSPRRLVSTRWPRYLAQR